MIQCLSRLILPEILNSQIFDQVTMRHPVYDLDVLEAQNEIAKTNGQNRTWFSGAWVKNGFHEDGLTSGLDVARKIISKRNIANSSGMTEIKIMSGQTWHGRRDEVENDFKYNIDYFDLKLEMSPWLLSKKGDFLWDKPLGLWWSQ